MEEFFVDRFGISPSWFNYVIIPLFIFLARLTDVSIATIRMMFVISGRKYIAPLLGFVEALIWLSAIGQIMQHLDNIYSYIAYAAGFASGTFAGILIEERLALGRVLVRIITREEATELISYLKHKEFRYSNVNAEGNKGQVNVLFTVIKRDELNELIPAINQYNPKAFYTIEGIKRVSDDEININSGKGLGLGSWWLISKRK